MKPHGTRACYCRGCRCEPCSEANRTYNREWHRKLMLQLGRKASLHKAEHGTNSKYILGCRCGWCTEAHRLYRRVQERRRGVPPRVPARNLRALRDCIESFGFSRRSVAGAVGVSHKTLDLSYDTVIQRTAEAIEGVHWGLWWRHGPFRRHCSCEVPEEVLRKWEAA